MGEVAPTEGEGEIEGGDGQLLEGRILDGAGDKVMFIEGNVYDVSEFMQVHPGGKLVMERLLGRDATEGFRKVGHSSSAREKLAQLLVPGKTTSDYGTPSPLGEPAHKTYACFGACSI
jgi:hypothetical protein